LDDVLMRYGKVAVMFLAVAGLTIVCTRILKPG
jgi:hypothetical protein